MLASSQLVMSQLAGDGPMRCESTSPGRSRGVRTRLRGPCSHVLPQSFARIMVRTLLARSPGRGAGEHMDARVEGRQATAQRLQA
jgi:hypothetical protein